MTHFIDHAALGLTGVVTVPALAHVLELPGKLRLNEAEYRTTQRIYFPGFTLAGVAELLAPVAVLGSWLAMPARDKRRAPTWIALTGLVCTQGVFWLVTQPVNRHWVDGAPLGRSGERFFGVQPEQAPRRAPWKRLRNRWEASHVVRAALAVTSLVALLVASRREG